MCRGLPDEKKNINSYCLSVAKLMFDIASVRRSCTFVRRQSCRRRRRRRQHQPV
jgi:hypothetical protein